MVALNTKLILFGLISSVIFCRGSSNELLRRRLGTAKCQVTGNITCTVIGSGIPCGNVVTLTNACGPTQVRYNFIYSNKNTNAVYLNGTKFWAITDRENHRSKMDLTPMKAGETRNYAMNWTLDTCTTGTYGQIKVEGWMNTSSWSYCYAYDFIPSPVTSITLPPSTAPSNRPTIVPSTRPSSSPSSSPTYIPSKIPTESPSKAPSIKPSRKPIPPISLDLSKRPSRKPTVKGTKYCKYRNTPSAYKCPK